jgi:hypothetical protein
VTIWIWALAFGEGFGVPVDWATSTARPTINPANTTDDVCLIRMIRLSLARDHIETTLAHRAPVRQDAEVPTFGDLHRAIEVVREIQYGTATGMTSERRTKASGGRC